MEPNDSKYYNKYINKLKELHRDYPQLAEDEALIGLQRLGAHIDKKKNVVHTKLFGDVETRKLIYVSLFIYMGLLGLTTIFNNLNIVFHNERARTKYSQQTII